MPDRRRGDRRRAVTLAVAPSVPSATATLAALERQSPDIPFEWFGADEATSYLGLPSRKALYQAVRRGQVPVHRLGPRRMRFRRVELDDLLKRSRQSPVLHSS